MVGSADARRNKGQKSIEDTYDFINLKVISWGHLGTEGDVHGSVDPPIASAKPLYADHPLHRAPSFLLGTVGKNYSPPALWGRVVEKPGPLFTTRLSLLPGWLRVGAIFTSRGTNGWRFPRGVDYEETEVLGHNRGAFGPKHFDSFEPSDNRVTEPTVEGVFSGAQLFIQAARRNQRDSGRMAINGPAFPNKPQIEIQNARCVSQSCHNFPFDRNPVVVNLIVERLTEGNDIPKVLAPTLGIPVVWAAPELHLVEKVKTCPVNQVTSGRLILGAEKHGGCKDVLKCVNEASIVVSIRAKAEESQQL